jgi:hypothetical protein
MVAIAVIVALLLITAATAGAVSRRRAEERAVADEERVQIAHDLTDREGRFDRGQAGEPAPDPTRLRSNAR